MPLLFAQSLVEYTSVSSNSSLGQSIGGMFNRFWEGARAMDQGTWLAIGGALVVLAFLTRRSRRQ